MAIRTHFDGVWRAVFADGSWVSWNLPNLFDPPSSHPSAHNNSTRCSILALALLLLCSQPRPHASLTIPPLSSCSCFRGIFSGQRCACWEGAAHFSSSFGLSCTIHFQAGEGDVKRAVRSMGRMLRFWGGDSGTPPPPDLIQADIVDESGQVIPAAAVQSMLIISRGARPGALGC
jgi:hypothetical protein